MVLVQFDEIHWQLYGLEASTDKSCNLWPLECRICCRKQLSRSIQRDMKEFEPVSSPVLLGCDQHGLISIPGSSPGDKHLLTTAEDCLLWDEGFLVFAVD